MPRASVLIPTHNHHTTLPLAVSSILWQKEQDFEVLIIGDGVTELVRNEARKLASLDARIKFLDFPKGENHGEVYRDLAIKQSLSQNIFYLCDDDLFTPSHLSNLIMLLEDNDLVQCRNGHISVEGQIRLFPTDLSSSFYIDWHLQDPPRNNVSLTGTAHRKSTYLALGDGWETTPEGEWPDHFMWKKFFRRPELKAATHEEMTAIQLPTSINRELLSHQERYAELHMWFEKFRDQQFEQEFQQMVQAAISDELNFYFAVATNYRLHFENLEQFPSGSTKEISG